MTAAMTPQSPPLLAEDPHGVELLVVGWSVEPGRLTADHARIGSRGEAAVRPVVVELGSPAEPRVHEGPLAYRTPPAVLRRRE